ncbi:MAG: hypothetical protein QOE83_2010 [Actinomycetota bacterium]|jgi:PAS domain S-box-containing protein|nr:hypothetical protein [Actinomycetota bacterium]
MAPDRGKDAAPESLTGLAQHALFDALEETADLVMVVRADDDRLLWVNAGFLAFAGAQLEGVLGKTLAELGLSVEGPPAAATPTAWDSPTAPSRFEFRRHDGEIRLFEGSRRAVGLKDHALVVTIARDVTVRDHVLDELRSSRGFVTEIVESMPVAFVAVDEGFRISYANNRAVELMSKPRIGLLGRALWEEFPDAAEPPFVDAANWAMEERVPVRVEQYYTPLDMWFEVSVVPIPSGLAIYVTDIHERRRRDSDVAQLASIVDSTEDAIMSVSTDGVFTSWNPAAERIFGYSYDEAIGSTLGSIMVPAGQSDDADELFKRVAQGEVLIAKEVRRWRKDGSHVDVSVTLSPIRDASGQLTGVSAISRDITRERRAAEELRDAEVRYRRLVEQVPIIIYDWGVQGDIEHVSENYVSPQIEGILGFKPEEWMADPTLWFSQVHPDDIQEVTAAVVRSIEDGVPLRVEYRMFAKDGQTVWLRDEALVLERDEDGRATLFQGVQLDITAEKRAEEALRRAADEKAQLIQLLAHELFTPITAIQGAALTLSSLGERLSPTDLSVLAEGVARGARRLQRLVQNLDAAAKLDRGDVAVSRRSVPIGEILRLALRDFQTESEASDINVSADEEIVGRRTVADLSLAAQALSVVIENALDYSDGAAVDIDLLESDGSLLIRVSDRGPGVTPEQRDHIFELFAQEDSSDTRSHEGLGVGLFLARRVMAVHGGELAYEARPDGGAMFTFHFVPSRTAG